MADYNSSQALKREEEKGPLVLPEIVHSRAAPTMANVFTKRHHRPRTTTMSDFGAIHILATPTMQRRARILSPTRRCNPHPKGLVSQKPYNKDLQTFDIWNPDFAKINLQMPQMIAHLECSNFTSGQVLPPIERNGQPPEIKYTDNSISRRSYQDPKNVFSEDFPAQAASLGRFGYTPFQPAHGIVPHALPPIYSPRHQ